MDTIFSLIGNIWLCLLSVVHPDPAAVHSLSDNVRNATPGQMAALGTTMGAAAWGAVQNRIPITPPTVAGPGIIDQAGYIQKIVTAGGPNEANRAAAKNLYEMLLPGMGETMNPMVDSLLDLGKR